MARSTDPLTKEKQMNKKTVLIEIRAAEGGDDAKALVYEQLAIYQKVAVRECL